MREHLSFPTLLLLVMILAMAPTPGHAQSPWEVVFYPENFNDDRPSDWDLESDAMLPAISYSDLDSLSPGTITFETPDDSVAVVDDIAVMDTQPTPISWTLQGRVYEGEVGTEKRPLEGVTVSLYGANDPYPNPGGRIASTTTDEYGWYGIVVPEGYEHYFIRETDLPDYVSVGATSVNGVVRTSNWIEYTLPLKGQTLTGNKFWDIREIELLPTPKGPDLAILSAENWEFEDDGSVLLLLVKIANHGDTRANQTRVYAGDPQHDWPGRESLVPAFNPEETGTIEIRLDIPEEQRGTTHVFTLELDPEDKVREIDERNNVGWTPGIFIPPLEVSPPPTEMEFDYPDLVILNAEFGEFSDDIGVLVLSVRVANRGNARANETQVYAWDPESGLLSEYSSVPALLPGEDEWVGIELAIPEEQRGITHTFRVEVDPEEMVSELNEGNNIEWTPGIFIPTLEVSPQPTEPSPPPTAMPVREGADPVPLILIVVTIATLGGITLIIRHYTITQHHKKWQVEAKKEEPPEHCQYCTHHCRKIELKLEPAMRKIAYLNLGAYDPGHGEQIKDGQVTGEIVDGLNKVVSARHRRANAEKLQELVTPLAHALLQQIIGSLCDELAPRDISITGHLEGGKVTCQFILYHCKRSGTMNIWEEEAKWKATIADERDEPVGILHSIDPAESGISERLTPALTRLLMQFIEKM